MSKSVRFLQFGCWNNLNLTKNKQDEPIPLGNSKKVMDLVKSRIMEHDPPDFIIVSGDNYYPDKIKSKTDKTRKEKVIFPERLIEGFASLPQNIEIFMILGNHDLETNNKDNLSILEDKTSITARTSVTKGSVKLEFKPERDRRSEHNEECEIIKLELDSLRNRANIKYFFFEAKRIHNTLVLMIDTSVYDIEHAKDYLPCYRKFFEHNNLYENKEKPIFANIQELRRYQLIQIIAALLDNSDITSVIIVGHHPIYQLKHKTKKDPPGFITEYKSDIHIDFTPVLEIIFTILPFDTKYYYLCSDLHLYQEGVIVISFKHSRHTNNMTIQQYIVGSGGTELDPKLESHLNVYHSTDSNQNTNITYTFTRQEHKYGFLDCHIESGKEPTFEFIHIPDIPIPIPDIPIPIPDIPISQTRSKSKSIPLYRSISRSISTRPRSKSIGSKSIGWKSIGWKSSGRKSFRSKSIGGKSIGGKSKRKNKKKYIRKTKKNYK